MNKKEFSLWEVVIWTFVCVLFGQSITQTAYYYYPSLSLQTPIFNWFFAIVAFFYFFKSKKRGK